MTDERREKLLKVINKRQSDLTVILENIEDPHNIAAVMRTCESVGIQDIYLLTTEIPQYKKKFGSEIGFRSASGAAKWLTIHEFSDAALCIDHVRKNFDRIYTTGFTGDSKDLYSLDLTESVAQVFGNEKYGITKELLEMADGNFLIPQMGIIQSLNISVACAVSVYEAFRQKRIAGHYDASKMPSEKKESLLKQWGINENI